MKEAAQRNTRGGRSGRSGAREANRGGRDKYSMERKVRLPRGDKFGSRSAAAGGARTGPRPAKVNSERNPNTWGRAESKERPAATNADQVAVTT